MGIEPTRHRFQRLTGFEDRGGHQTSKRFLKRPMLRATEPTNNQTPWQSTERFCREKQVFGIHLQGKAPVIW